MLENLGVDFAVRPVDIDETPHDGEQPQPYVLRLARAKAEASDVGPEDVVLAADTIVASGDELLGKPRDPDDARRMLAQLSGRKHEVLTGVAVTRAGHEPHAEVERTRVWFAELSEAEIAWYVESGEPLDKAGAYAIQGLGALFVTRLEGNYSNVVGLPLPLTYRLLAEFGFSLRTTKEA